MGGGAWHLAVKEGALHWWGAQQTVEEVCRLTLPHAMPLHPQRHSSDCFGIPDSLLMANTTVQAAGSIVSSGWGDHLDQLEPKAIVVFPLDVYP